MFVHVHTKTTNHRKGGYQHESGGCMLAGVRRESSWETWEGEKGEEV